MALISQRSMYVISALLLLLKEPFGKTVSANALAEKLNAPAAYLSQSLARLIPIGILGSSRGKTGGVYLKKTPDSIMIFDVITAVDGDKFLTECVMGIPGCGDNLEEYCPFHDQWSTFKGEIIRWLQTTTFEQAALLSSDEWFRDRMKFPGIKSTNN
ncbi:MAG: Rrf2 family transcriptional regulator [FCB group bacterium]|nr:Rrf2 family transcriptional regulator [FCB group bacterium]